MDRDFPPPPEIYSSSLRSNNVKDRDWQTLVGDLIDRPIFGADLSSFEAADRKEAKPFSRFQRASERSRQDIECGGDSAQEIVETLSDDQDKSRLTRFFAGCRVAGTQVRAICSEQ